MAKERRKKTDILVLESKYEGKYVAFDPSAGKKVIASGRNPGTVVARARELGVQVPAIVFDPKSKVPLIY